MQGFSELNSNHLLNYLDPEQPSHESVLRVLTQTMLGKIDVESRGICFLMTQFLSKTLQIFTSKGLDAEAFLVECFQKTGISDPSIPEFKLFAQRLICLKEVC